MGTIAPVGSIPDPPDIIVTGTTHPTPFPTTSDWPGWTFDMIAAIQLLNPATAITWLSVRFEPNPRGCIRREIILPGGGRVFLAGHVWVDRSATLETCLESADDTSEMGCPFYTDISLDS